MFKGNNEICGTCALFYRDCQCSSETTIALEHRVTLITTNLESLIRSNTGRLLQLRLTNMKTIYLGRPGWEEEVIAEKTNSDYFPVLLFPCPGSKPVSEVVAIEKKPLNIFVFDTSWRSARKWINKDIFHDIKKVELKKNYVSRYYLRVNPNQNYLCTFQSLTCLLIEINEKFEPTSNDLMKTMDYVVKCMAKERNQKYIIDGEEF